MISIIVTCYNVGPFIAEALSSILEIEGVEKEIIVVDDASKDNTVEIVEDLAGLFPDASFVVHSFEENTPGGVAAAANYGMSVAKGEYIAFLDGDDWLYPEPFKRALARLKQEKCDFVMVNSNEFGHLSGEFSWYEDLGLWARFSPKAYRKRLIKHALKRAIIGASRIGLVRRRMPQSLQSPLKSMHARHFKHFSVRDALFGGLTTASVQSSTAARKALLQMGPFPWRKIYRRDFIEANGLRFPEGDWMFEDNPFHWQVTLAAKSFIVHDEITYSHRIWSGQTIAKANSGALAILDHAELIAGYIRGHDAWETYADDFAIWLADHVYWAYMSVRIEDKKRVFERAEEVCANNGLMLVEVMQMASANSLEYKAMMSAYIVPGRHQQSGGET